MNDIFSIYFNVLSEFTITNAEICNHFRYISNPINRISYLQKREFERIHPGIGVVAGLTPVS